MKTGGTKINAKLWTTAEKREGKICINEQKQWREKEEGPIKEHVKLLSMKIGGTKTDARLWTTAP